MTISLLFIVWAAFILPYTLAKPELPDWYSCTRDNCLPPACRCARFAHPGRLPLEKIPQFILLTHDDAVNEQTMGNIGSLIDGRIHKGSGCRLPATWFVVTSPDEGNDCAAVRQRWSAGDEIACHTKNHVKLYSELTISQTAAEIIGSRRVLREQCGIPGETLTGFRAPHLVHGPNSRKMLHEAHFKYDASISIRTEDEWARLWPYSMDHGIPQNCYTSRKAAQCRRDESYPGLWEVPVWSLQHDEATFWMDPGHVYGSKPSQSVFEVLKENFEAAYGGNRAPLPIFVHLFWFNETRVREAVQFIEFALERPGVYFVTMSQLIEWMGSPVPIDDMDAWMMQRCGPRQLPWERNTEGGQRRRQGGGSLVHTETGSQPLLQWMGARLRWRGIRRLKERE